MKNEVLEMHQISDFVDRINSGEWRTPIYCDLIMEELRHQSTGNPLTLLEIGCGRGFDGERGFQEQLARRVVNYLGVEPDPQVEPEPVFTQTFRTYLEDACIEPESVDLAFSIMVMEHVQRPESFLDSLYRVLRPGGVYLGFTVDRRHWFATVAYALSKVRLKSPYLSLVSGHPRGEGRYLDYPTEYRLNTPEAVASLSSRFSMVEVWNAGPVESAAHYVPRVLRPLVRRIEGIRIPRGGARTNLVVRLVK